MGSMRSVLQMNDDWPLRHPREHGPSSYNLYWYDVWGKMLCRALIVRFGRKPRVKIDLPSVHESELRDPMLIYAHLVTAKRWGNETIDGRLMGLDTTFVVSN